MSLFDRSYMRPEQPRGGKPDDGSSMIWSLLLANVLVYLLFSSEVATLALSWGGLRGFKVYQLVTAGFFHQDFSHIFFNMWGLYLFGKLVAPHLGSARFLILYLIGVVSGNLLFLLFNWNSTVPTYLFGASGAVCAIMTAAAMLEPRRQFVLIFMPFFPLRTPTLVVSYTVLEILLQLSGSQSGVAHLAHLGGFLGGYLYLKILFGARLPWDPFRRRVRPGDWKQPPSWGGESNSRPEPAPGEGPVSSHELDALLDKISRNGINSLTAHELARLRRAREEMRGNQWR